MTKYLLSRYSFLQKINNSNIFFHSLLLNHVIVCDKDFSIDGNTIYIDGNSALFKTLKQGKFIIDSEKNDDDLLEQARCFIKEPYISTAYFFVTQNCNLACKYCFERQSEIENSNEGVMTCETIERGIDFFSRLTQLDMTRFNEKKTIIFYGGEPFHNKKTLYFGIEKVHIAIREGALPENTKIIVVTNGTLLTDDDIKRLKTYNVTLTFSLDGDEESSKNRVFPDMQTLAWKKATQTFIKCKEAGINLNVACTLSPETLKRQKETLDYFIHTVKANNIGFNAILENDIIQVNENYDDMAAEFVTSSYPILKQHNITENRTQRRIQVFENKRPCLFDCNAAGGRQIAIAPDGSVGICHEHIMDKQHFITTIHDDFNPTKSPQYLEWNKRSPLYMDECQHCIAIGICGGGCVINTERKYGTIWKPDTRFCKQTLNILTMLLNKSVKS